MSRTGDQSLSTPNGDGDMATALQHALELESIGVVPYTIDENGYFKSTRMYPRMCIYTQDAMIPISGDTLLEVRGDKGNVLVTFSPRTPNVTFKGDEKTKTLKLFDGLPISGQVHQPCVSNMESIYGVFAVFEVYGPKYRKMLIQYRDKSNGDCGVKLYDKQKNKSYQAFGCVHSGFCDLNSIREI